MLVCPAIDRQMKSSWKLRCEAQVKEKVRAGQNQHLQAMALIGCDVVFCEVWSNVSQCVVPGPAISVSPEDRVEI